MSNGVNASRQMAVDPAPLMPIIFENLVLHQALFAAAELGVADALGDGTKDCAQLATAVHADESSLRRTLRLLATHKIFHEAAPGRFENTAASNCLRSDAPASWRAMARFRGSDFVYRS